MDWKAANEQQQEALWRNFLMFVVMALLVIRTGLVSRGVVAILSAQNAARYDAEPPVNHQSSRAPPVDLVQATLVALLLAEAAGQLFILNARAVWELMNRPLAHPANERLFNIADLCERPAQRLDTS